MKPRQTVTHLSRHQLLAHPDNVRHGLGDLTDMARSIREHGILQPLTVTEVGAQNIQRGHFLILAGHRRFRAGLAIGLDTFPVIIRHGLTDAAEHTVVMLVENTQRRDLDPLEKALAYRRLADAGLSQSEIARRVGVTPSTVNYYLAFLDLDEDTKADVRAGKIRAKDARDAVVEARQKARETQGTPKRGRPASYFGPAHRLARTVAQLCDHADRPVVGKAGCGECWEKALVDEFVEANRQPGQAAS